MAINLFSKLFWANRFAAYQPIQTVARMHSAAQNVPAGPVAGGAWSMIPIRTNIRNHFPRPREVKRVLVHGWHNRMSKPSGRRIIMRRILKGCHCLSH